MTNRERFQSEHVTNRHDRSFAGFSAEEMTRMAHVARGIFTLDPKADVYMDARCNLCEEAVAFIKWHRDIYLSGGGDMIALNWPHWRELMKPKFMHDEFIMEEKPMNIYSGFSGYWSAGIIPPVES